ncbi:MAG: PRC-barrel domain-containing protein [Methanobrevibacter sp.]|jgi:sporulation protein YlmC with PRC-barrel domain|nr:PRC-barrel domain-containing protein [Candidatus Methanovirga aequatorialis]
MEENITVKKEEKLWADVRGYRVATNNARILGQLEELIVNEKTGKIVDIVVRANSDKNINIKGSKTKGDYVFIPFSRVEKVGEFIIVTE